MDGTALADLLLPHNQQRHSRALSSPLIFVQDVTPTPAARSSSNAHSNSSTPAAADTVQVNATLTVPSHKVGEVHNV